MIEQLLNKQEQSKVLKEPAKIPQNCIEFVKDALKDSSLQYFDSPHSSFAKPLNLKMTRLQETSSPLLECDQIKRIAPNIALGSRTPQPIFESKRFRSDPLSALLVSAQLAKLNQNISLIKPKDVESQKNDSSTSVRVEERKITIIRPS